MTTAIETAAQVFAEPIQVLTDRRAADDEILNGILDATKEPTLGDLIRLGSTVTEQAVGEYGNGVEACALSAAYVAAKAYEVL
jgi:hypothetical protein